MFVKCIVVAIILMSAFAWSGQATAGWVIEETTKAGGVSGKQQVMLQSNRMKSLIFGETGKLAMAFIVDLDADTITQVDYEGRRYATSTVQDYVQTMKGAMAGAMKEMQESLKQMPPEQRKMAEEMMRSQMGQTGKDCGKAKVEVRKSGQQATIAGYPATRYDVLVNGKLDSEVWIAKGLTAWRELDSKKLERFVAEMEKLTGCGPGQGGFGVESSWRLANEGYSVKTVDKTGDGATVELIKAESRTLAASEFQPPAGFARKALKEMGQ